MLRLGIVGLPNVGKSTLFNALTSSRAQAENYPFCTVDPNVGVVAVPDERLGRLEEVVKPKSVVPATVEFVDIAGLVEGASKGEGLGNQFLGHIREVDAIVHVVRCFDDPDVTHVSGGVDPVRDHDIITNELALSDLVVLERRLERAEKTARSGEQEAKYEVTLLNRTIEVLNAGGGARDAVQSDEDRKILRQLGLLTLKPVLYAANVGEDELGSSDIHTVRVLQNSAREHHEEAEVVTFSAKFEAELLELDPAERNEFLSGVGLSEPGLNRIVRAGYRLLGLHTFFTAGEQEVRAWTMPLGATAYDAAGEIHSDFQRGFIRAETVAFSDFVAVGGYPSAREKGLIRSEGREYVVQDGDVLLFRFNV